MDFGGRLDLADAAPIASGTYRDLYIHPHDPGLAVKVLKPGAAYRPGRPIRNFLKARSVGQLYRFLYREYEEYLTTRLKIGTGGAAMPLSELMWLQPTSRGLGMVAERIRGPGEAPARTLSAIAGEGPLSDGTLACLNAFIAALNGLDVTVNDTNPENVLLDETGPAPRFVLVDGFGDPHPLRLKRLSHRLRRRARTRRFRLMADFLGLTYDEAAGRLVRP